MEINPINVQNHVWSIEMGGLGRPEIQGAQNQGAQIDGIQLDGPSAPKFESLFAQEVDKLNTQMISADQAVADLATGKSENIHGALIEMQKANLSFRMLVEVRNKALSAYEELMRMQA